MRTWTIIGTTILITAIASGCGGGVSQRRSTRPSSRTQPTIRGTSFPEPLRPAAQAEEFDYNGWSAFRLTNGLVTVVVVPAIGGRIMEYTLGDYPFLWVNPDEAGPLHEPPQTAEERVWHNYGGYKAWPAPQKQWGGPPDPLGSNLESGEWTSEVTTPRGPVAEVELVSLEDKEVTGLQITRQIKLFAGTTRLAVTETFRNVSDQPITWSIWTVTQVPGSLSDKKYNEESRIYFPLNPNSKHEQGFWPLTAEKQSGGPEQFRVIDGGKLMQVSYRNKFWKIGADCVAGWMAYVDELHEYAYIKRFPVHKLDDYPDQGATVEVYTNGGDLSYMEMEVLSPIHTLQPGDQFSVTEEWYATQIGGPIRDTTELAAIREPLQIATGEEGLRLTGELGIFAPGTLKITLLDAADQPVGEAITRPVNPAEAVVLDQNLPAGDGAAKLILTLVNQNGTPLGVVAELPVPTITAQAH